MDRNDHIILRYLIGTVVEIVVLVALAIAAIIGVLEAIGWFIEWAARNMPDWMIIPEFMMIFVLAFIAMFPEIFFKPKKRVIRGYRQTLYPQEEEANVA